MKIVVAGTLPLNMDNALELSVIDINGNEPLHVSIDGKDKTISNTEQLQYLWWIWGQETKNLK